MRGRRKFETAQWRLAWVLLFLLSGTGASVYVSAREGVKLVKSAANCCADSDEARIRTEQSLLDSTRHLESRVDAFDRLDIPARLAVLDEVKGRISRLETLMWSSMLGLLGNFVMWILQMVKQRPEPQTRI